MHNRFSKQKTTNQKTDIYEKRHALFYKFSFIRNNKKRKVNK